MYIFIYIEYCIIYILYYVMYYTFKWCIFHSYFRFSEGYIPKTDQRRCSPVLMALHLWLPTPVPSEMEQTLRHHGVFQDVFPNVVALAGPHDAWEVSFGFMNVVVHKCVFSNVFSWVSRSEHGNLRGQACPCLSHVWDGQKRRNHWIFMDFLSDLVKLKSYAWEDKTVLEQFWFSKKYHDF